MRDTINSSVNVSFLLLYAFLLSFVSFVCVCIYLQCVCVCFSFSSEFSLDFSWASLDAYHLTRRRSCLGAERIIDAVAQPHGRIQLSIVASSS